MNKTGKEPPVMPLPAATPTQRSAQKETLVTGAKPTTESTPSSTRDSNLVKFVREGENIASRVRQDTAMRRVLGVGLLMLAALLFIPPWFLIPGLVLAGFSLLGFNPFRFGSCGRSGRSSSRGSSPTESTLS